MATTTTTTAIISPKASQLGTKIETFSIHGSRTVHGKAFPLGIRPKQGLDFRNIDSAVEHLKTLGKSGTFDRLLSQRELQSSLTATLLLT